MTKGAEENYRSWLGWAGVTKNAKKSCRSQAARADVTESAERSYYSWVGKAGVTKGVEKTCRRQVG